MKFVESAEKFPKWSEDQIDPPTGGQNLNLPAVLRKNIDAQICRTPNELHYGYNGGVRTSTGGTE